MMDPQKLRGEIPMTVNIAKQLPLENLFANPNPERHYMRGKQK